ncbi:MAG: hypothetical protein KDC87_21705 [Planctomycetes bacterium]|nr:hypothetical protein [Planctomycetota bacterium]MCB9872417.1 hypothetical protein [Planctomycetota bacterium]MCB9888382.1 hypothetical protein [Planctomycetota bacterium]
MKLTAIPDLFYWSVYQPDRRIDFNGFYWRRPDGGVLIDPMPTDPQTEQWLEQQPGGVAWILLSNADHVRAGPQLRTRFGAAMLAPLGDQGALGLEPDAWFAPDHPLPTSLRDDIRVAWLRGGKTPAEAAFYLAPLRALVFGDAVRSHASGILRLLPDEKIQDRAALARDITALAVLDVAAVLLGDGDCLFTGAHAAFAQLVGELEAN